MGKQPYIPLYIGDWEQDLNCVSLEAEGAALKLIFKLWKSDTKGLFTISFSQMAILFKKTPEKTLEIFNELKENRVFDYEKVSETTVIIKSRRMLREVELSKVRSDVGRKGGTSKKAKLKQNLSKHQAKAKQNPEYEIEDEDENKELESEENLKVISQEKVIFENFRIKYPGVKKGLDTEFLNFQRRHKDWKEVVHILESKLNNQIHWRQLTKGFVPEWKHLQTWINQRDWEIEVENIQLISNNTSNGQPKFGGKLDTERISQTTREFLKNSGLGRKAY